METDLNILIIESDPSISAGLEKKIKHLGFRRSCTTSPDKPIGQLEAGPFLDKETSLKCIHKLRIIDPSIPILTSCEENSLSEDSTASFEGVHLLGQDIDPDDILKAIENALKHRAEAQLRPDFPSLIGQSPEIKSIRKKIRKVCDKDITVLATGDTGTGKELVARSIHYHSLRSGGPLELWSPAG
jgi:two-component system nitrogen regulation response regulator GlnG